MEGNEALVQLLSQVGVDTVFSLMSEDIKILSSRLSTTDIDVIEARHEQDAVSMADGFARVTGRLGVCIVGRGPAIAQTGNGLITAQRRGSDVLIVVPESPLSATYDTKEFEQTQFLRTTAGDVVTVRDEARLVPGFDEALRSVASGDSPVVLQIAWDVLDSETSLTAEAVQATTSYTAADEGESYVEPGPTQIQRVADLFESVTHEHPPVVLAGTGALAAGAQADIEQLAGRMGAVLATTLPMQSYFETHPYSIGFVGGFGTERANEFLQQTDLLLALGCSLNPHTTHNGELVSDETTVVHVDTDPTAVGRHTPADLGVHGDVRATAAQLTAALDDRGVDDPRGWWTVDLRERLAASAPDLGDPPVDDTGPADPRHLVSRLDELLPEQRVVVTDGGHFVNWIMDYVDVPGPESFLWTLDFSSIGRGLPVGIGAAETLEERCCVVFTGDAGLLMSLPELGTAARESVPMYVVVLNDGGYGAEYHQLDLEDKHPESALVETPDIPAVAEGFGCRGHSVNCINELDTIEFRDVPEQPVVLDCQVTRGVRHRFYEEYHGI